MKITKQELNSATNAIKAVLGEVSKKSGMLLEYEGGTYGDKGMIKISVKPANANSEEGRKEAYLQQVDLFKYDGFTADDYGREVKNHQGTFRLIGFNPSKPKNAIKLYHIESDSDTYQCSVEQAQRLFGIKPL